MSVHVGVSCDGCGESPLSGVRHRCLECLDYDLCSSCRGMGIHSTHRMKGINASIQPSNAFADKFVLNTPTIKSVKENKPSDDKKNPTKLLRQKWWQKKIELTEMLQQHAASEANKRRQILDEQLKREQIKTEITKLELKRLQKKVLGN